MLGWPQRPVGAVNVLVLGAQFGDLITVLCSHPPTCSRGRAVRGAPPSARSQQHGRGRVRLNKVPVTGRGPPREESCTDRSFDLACSRDRRSWSPAAVRVSVAAPL